MSGPSVLAKKAHLGSLKCGAECMSEALQLQGDIKFCNANGGTLLEVKMRPGTARHCALHLPKRREKEMSVYCWITERMSMPGLTQAAMRRTHCSLVKHRRRSGLLSRMCIATDPSAIGRDSVKLPAARSLRRQSPADSRWS